VGVPIHWSFSADPVAQALMLGVQLPHVPGQYVWVAFGVPDDDPMTRWDNWMPSS